MSNDDPPAGAKEWRDQGEDPEAKWYLTFISIIFGVFIAVWIQAFFDIIPVSTTGSDTSNTAEEIRKMFSVLITERGLRGAVMFVMLICLWWWYGTFLGRIAPARLFWSYFYDFVSLCAFAVAFRMWDHQLVFPMIVFIAATLMFGRFLTATKHMEWRTPQGKALITALVALLFFMGAAALAIWLVYKTDVEVFLNSHWNLVQEAPMGLLLLGIAATFVAVMFTDGLPFRPLKTVADKSAKK